MSAAGIHIEGLSKEFRGNRVLDSVDLDVAPGERVALIGANGAGKTTLIRCLLGEYVCDGRIELCGLSPRSDRTQVLGRIGFVPQLPPPLKMPVAQLLDFAAAVCGSNRDRMFEVSTRLGLEPQAIARQPFEKLSGGQKQKLLIAVALGRDSDVLILDEPAANLDPEARGTFFRLLADHGAHATMLISSHRLDEVASLVHRVVELDHGRVSLDDRIADPDSLTARFACRIEVSRQHEAVARALRDWGLRENADGRVFEGHVAGPDRLRFLSTVTRYSGLVASLELREAPSVEA